MNTLIELREITWENLWKIINLKPAESQKDHLPSNAVFMAMAYVNLKLQYPDACFAIYHGENAVGFTKILFIEKGEEQFNLSKDTYFIDAIMIDEKYQGRGYGTSALEQILSFIRKKPWGHSDSIRASCYDKNIVMVRLLEKAGFTRTDKLDREKDGLRVYTIAL